MEGQGWLGRTAREGDPGPHYGGVVQPIKQFSLAKLMYESCLEVCAMKFEPLLACFTLHRNFDNAMKVREDHVR